MVDLGDCQIGATIVAQQNVVLDTGPCAVTLVTRDSPNDDFRFESSFDEVFVSRDLLRLSRGSASTGKSCKWIVEREEYCSCILWHRIDVSLL